MGYDFLVIGLPRSGTAWLSTLLSYGRESLCIHEPQCHLALTGGLLKHARRTYGMLGAATTCGNLSGFSAPRMVMVERDHDDSWEALVNSIDIPDEKLEGARETFEMAVRAMDFYRDGCHVVRFEDLFDPAGSAGVWNYVFGSNLPALHHLELRRLRVTAIPQNVDVYWRNVGFKQVKEN